MKIIALNSSKNWGGNERWLTSAMNALALNNHSIFLVHRKHATHWNNLHPSIKLIDAPYTNELSIKTKSIIREIIDENDIDILLSTKRKDYILAAQIKNKVNVSHIMRLGISRPILKRDFIQRYIISNQVDGIIVNAIALKKELLSYKFIKRNFNSDNIVCIHNGYDTLRAHNDNEVNKNRIFKIRSAGRLTVHKGYDILIESLRKFDEFNIEYKIEIAGDGPEFNNLNNLINKYNLQNNCELVGLNNDIVSFFNGADLVVIPSRSEGIPNTLFEAWMAKKPVIATNVGGVSEAIDHEVNGIICEPKSDELLTAFKNFINNKNLYKDIGRNGYNTLIESFSMATMTKKLENYFQSFIK